MIKTERNSETGIMEAFIPATIHAVGKPTLTNTNGTNYGLASCDVEYPDGSSERVNAVIWENSYDTGLFNDGDSVLLRTQIEGEYAGNAVVQLPGAVRVDVSKFEFAEATEPVATTA